MNLADYVGKDCSNLKIVGWRIDPTVMRVEPHSDGRYRVVFNAGGYMDSYSQVSPDGCIGMGNQTLIVAERVPTPKNTTDNVAGQYTYGIYIEDSKGSHIRRALGSTATLAEAKERAKKEAQANPHKTIYIFAPIAVFKTDELPVTETTLTL